MTPAPSPPAAVSRWFGSRVQPPKYPPTSEALIGSVTPPDSAITSETRVPSSTS